MCFKQYGIDEGVTLLSNTRFHDNVFTYVDNFLTDKVRSLFMLYKSTTSDVIFLSRSHGGIGVKLFSSLY